ncbi:nitrilase [bacterium]|nr:MAG: nitrilase [bacterium]
MESPTIPAQNVRVAVVQAAPVAFDLEATLTKVRQLAGEAARTGAQLAVFPEAFVSAYPRGMDFGAAVGSRTPEGREWFRRYWASSVEVPGAACSALGEIARECALYLVIGVIERDGGTLYCSVLTFEPSGRLLGKHRKVMPTASERLIWGYGDGSTLSVYPTAIGNLGAVICWENYMPLLRMAMYGKQVQIYCAPTADGRDTWLATMQHIALEGRCFVLSCNQYATRSDYPADYPVAAAERDEVLSRGGSCIVDPFGRLLAGPDYSGESILTAELDLAQVVRAKFDFDVVGHYARPDIFHLEVDERATPAVRTQAPGDLRP